MGKIRILKQEVANQIAAGEVVERPASILKEFLENSLDAEATRIEISIEKGGKSLIAVHDNGCGMNRNDALLSLERHSTSKISSVEEIETALSYGFRGEALPSIASISRFNLKTNEDAQTPGTEIEIEGGIIKSVRDIGFPRGTSVRTRDIFFNVPARKKFMKKIPTELGHCLKTAEEIAVAQPAVHFKMIHNNRIMFDLPGAPDREERVFQLFKASREELVEIRRVVGDVRVEIFLTPPALPHAFPKTQIVVVNSRPVSDRLVYHAVKTAYSEFPGSDQPFSFFLFLDLPGNEIDVNVHPRKREIKFRDSHLIHSLITESIKEAFSGLRPAASIPGGAPGSMLYGEEGAGEPAGEQLALHSLEETESYGPRLETAIIDEKRGGSPPVILAQYKNAFIVAEEADALLLIDQHVAHERVLFEKILSALESETPSSSQMLLNPVTLELSPSRAALLEEQLDSLKLLGFEMERFGAASFLIRSVPAYLGKESVEELIFQLTEEPSPAGREDRIRKIAALSACHSAVKAGEPLNLDQMKRLVRDLFQCRSPYTCPHGRPILLRFAQRDIEKGFKRR